MPPTAVSAPDRARTVGDRAGHRNTQCRRAPRHNKEAERIRIQFIRLNEFRESWIPTLKTGGFRQFQLFDLEQAITQRTDVSGEHPEVVEKLKQALLETHASVMLDGPDWNRVRVDWKPDDTVMPPLTAEAHRRPTN